MTTSIALFSQYLQHFLSNICCSQHLKGSVLQAQLDSLESQQPSVDKSSSTTSLTWRGITYHVSNQRVRANLQQVAELSQQQEDRMQTDQQTHETAQYDALLGALNETKANLGSILKSAPGLYLKRAPVPAHVLKQQLLPHSIICLHCSIPICRRQAESIVVAQSVHSAPHGCLIGVEVGQAVG